MNNIYNIVIHRKIKHFLWVKKRRTFRQMHHRIHFILDITKSRKSSNSLFCLIPQGIQLVLGITFGVSCKHW